MQCDTTDLSDFEGLGETLEVAQGYGEAAIIYMEISNGTGGTVEMNPEESVHLTP